MFASPYELWFELMKDEDRRESEKVLDGLDVDVPAGDTVGESSGELCVELSMVAGWAATEGDSVPFPVFNGGSAAISGGCPSSRPIFSEASSQSLLTPSSSSADSESGLKPFFHVSGSDPTAVDFVDNLLLLLRDGLF